MKWTFSADNQPFFIIGGQVHNSSAYDLQSMEIAWKSLELIKANTAEVPIYWEQVEPNPDQFSFDHLDQIIQAARKRGLHLILLWFATWKNGSMQYTPQWVKTNPTRFERVINPAGASTWVLSSHCDANWKADCKAYCTLLRHLRAVDVDQKTVIGTQIENEPGILGSVRDYSRVAQAEFGDPVPKEVLDLIGAHPGNADWESVFGDKAAEYFSAWSVARYIDRLAAKGKEIYELPVYVNVWIKENGWHLPGINYPSGGATTNVLDIWKRIGKHIDLIAPDIYVQNLDIYRLLCQSYSRPDNPLFIPESGNSQANAILLFEAIAHYQAIGYAIFGIESLLDQEGNLRPEARPIVDSFHCLAAARPLIEQYSGTGKIHSVGQQEWLGEQLFDFDSYLGLARFVNRPAGGWEFTDFNHYPPDKNQRGRGLIFTPRPNEFYLVGSGYSLFLRPKVNERMEFSKASADYDAPLTHYLAVEEGHFNHAGNWIVDRTRNGDEITGGLWVAPDIGVLHAVLTE